ncbi:mast cell-expressed membrane protein 1 isoform X2 [Choloepus didactylus]|uniref:mast cell-expressed membrane protein 1 isoform X2 n=1 Tax=Choloepus didactylus TaxID=27675 RepID=UPI00189E1B63|nr:mast cell-expressed membrane protein 1 isoform X2 [Choloepus didactylus]
MQTAEFNKKQKGPAKNKGADDPDYENVILTFRNQGQPRGCHSSPKSQVPTQSTPSSDLAKIPHWFHRAITSLYILLAVIFIFCIILSALVLVKNSEMSQELLALKQELWNNSNLVRECQEEQKTGSGLLREDIQETKNFIKSNFREGNGKLEKLQAEALSHLPPAPSYPRSDSNQE